MPKTTKNTHAHAHAYAYGLKARPAGLGTVPKGAYTVAAPLAGALGQEISRHGVLLFERKLDADELSQFELVEIAADARQTELAKKVAKDLASHRSACLVLADRDRGQFERLTQTKLRGLTEFRLYAGEVAEFAQKVKDCLTQEDPVTPNAKKNPD